jgi:hypothetical protein
VKYLCMIYSDESNPVTLSDAEQDALMDEHLAYDDELRRSGHYIEAQALQPNQTAAIARAAAGRAH